MSELPALSAGRDSFSITSNSSSRAASFIGPNPENVGVPASQYGRAASPLPPATPPSVYSC
jgi:hypothetical protein